MAGQVKGLQREAIARQCKATSTAGRDMGGLVLWVLLQEWWARCAFAGDQSRAEVGSEGLHILLAPQSAVCGLQSAVCSALPVVGPVRSGPALIPALALGFAGGCQMAFHHPR